VSEEKPIEKKRPRWTWWMWVSAALLLAALGLFGWMLATRLLGAFEGMRARESHQTQQQPPAQGERR